jgi:hypothetical protein
MGRVPVPDLPHNLAASGSVVIATHPSTGRLARFDVSTGEITTVAVGSEPHDVDFSSDGTQVFVSEDGGKLIILDAVTLEQVNEVALSGPAHDAVVTDDGIWVTMVGREELGLISGSEVELFPPEVRPTISSSMTRAWFGSPTRSHLRSMSSIRPPEPPRWRPPVLTSPTTSPSTVPIGDGLHGVAVGETGGFSLPPP